MERLWAPWRGRYVAGDIAGAEPAGDPPPCFLCTAGAEGGDLVVHRDEATVTLLNLYPYNAGHLLVAPRAHVADLGSAGDQAAAALAVAVRAAMRTLDAALHPDGFNVGLNQGEAAGGSVDHLHMHVVPRWAGDTNFMPVVGAVKVLSELPADTAERLRRARVELTR